MKKKLKKIITGVLTGVMMTLALAGCGAEKVKVLFTVFSREVGFGSRGAFVELMGIEE